MKTITRQILSILSFISIHNFAFAVDLTSDKAASCNRLGLTLEERELYFEDLCKLLEKTRYFDYYQPGDPGYEWIDDLPYTASTIYYSNEVYKKYLRDVISSKLKTFKDLNIYKKDTLLKVIPLISNQARAMFYENCRKLHEFSANNELVKLKELLGTGAFDINAIDEHGNSALHFSGNVEITELLILHGANVNIQANDGYTPLISAAHHGDVGDVQKVELLLKYGADRYLSDFQGKTALKHAVENSCSDLYSDRWPQFIAITKLLLKM